MCPVVRASDAVKMRCLNVRNFEMPLDGLTEVIYRRNTDQAVAAGVFGSPTQARELRPTYLVSRNSIRSPAIDAKMALSLFTSCAEW